MKYMSILKITINNFMYIFTIYPGLSIERFQRGSCTFLKTHRSYRNIQIVQKVWLVRNVREERTGRTQVLQVMQVRLTILCVHVVR